MDLPNRVPIPNNLVSSEQRPTNEQELQHSGRIPYFTFRGLIAALFCIAVLAVGARVFIRIRTRRFGLDDYIVLFAIMCLSTSTGVLMKYTRILFIMEATLFNTAYKYTIEDYMESGNFLAVVNCLPPLTWTTIYFVKFSFLVLFRRLINCVSKRITIYFWVVVCLSVLAWGFACFEPFISCHYFGESQLCMVLSRRLFMLDATVVSLDMTTDIMIIIIPILILRKSLMKLCQKIGLAALLCLSIFMVILAIVRMTAYADHPRVMDLAWSAFWIHVEACVAVLMASISVVLPLFVNRGREKGVDEEKNPVPLPLDGKRHLNKNKNPDRMGWEDMGREGQTGASLATLAQIHRFIYDDVHLAQESEPVKSRSLSIDEESQLRDHVSSPQVPKRLRGK